MANTTEKLKFQRGPHGWHLPIRVTIEVGGKKFDSIYEVADDIIRVEGLPARAMVYSAIDSPARAATQWLEKELQEMLEPPLAHAIRIFGDVLADRERRWRDG